MTEKEKFPKIKRLYTLAGRESWLEERWLVGTGMDAAKEKEAFCDYWISKNDWAKPEIAALKGIMTFLEDAQDGDIVQCFDSFPVSGILSGRAGILILRNNTIVKLYTTRMA